MDDYADVSSAQLIEALEQAGRTPDPKLIAACMARGDELVPGLLEPFRAELVQVPDWPQDDPRWYATIHAGRLLLAQRVEEALPLFVEHYEIDEDGVFSEWIHPTDLTHYGPDVWPVLHGLFADRTCSPWLRWGAGDAMARLAHAYPALREPVLEALHGALPPLDGDGSVDVPDDAHEDAYVLWTATLRNLAELGDETARPAAHALHEAGFFDEWMFGGMDDFERILTSEAPDDVPDEIEDYDVVELYRAWRAGELRRAREQQAYEQRKARAKIAEGKIGRNDRVTIRNPDTGEQVEDIKYKHAQKKLGAGWVVVKA